MDKKAIIATLVAVVVTFLATTFLNRGEEVVQAGIDAQTEAVIKRVLQEEMTVDIDGETKTYGQVLSSLHTKVTANAAVLEVLIEE